MIEIQKVIQVKKTSFLKSTSVHHVYLKKNKLICNIIFSGFNEG